MSQTTGVGAVILAAGASSRLGEPKQLLEYQNKPLLQGVVDRLAPFNFATNIVVLGAYADDIRRHTRLDGVTAVENPEWEEGIASSIRAGVDQALQIDEALEALLFLLSDQPFVSAGLIRELVATHKGNPGRIIACRYKGSLGVPAVFPKPYFTMLQELSGDVGAKKIIMGHPDQVEEVAFERGGFDVDTPEDYEELNNSN